MYLDADYLILLLTFLCCFGNRQSLIFLCAFVATEIPHHFDTPQIYDDCVIASMFAYLVFYCRNYKLELQSAMCAYSLVFWYAAIDYLLFPHSESFYVIFPYVIKLIDIYVIYHLIRKEGQSVGSFYRAPDSAFYKRLHGL